MTTKTNNSAALDALKWLTRKLDDMVGSNEILSEMIDENERIIIDALTKEAAQPEDYHRLFEAVSETLKWFESEFNDSDYEQNAYLSETHANLFIAFYNVKIIRAAQQNAAQPEVFTIEEAKIRFDDMGWNDIAHACPNGLIIRAAQQNMGEE